MLLSDPTLPAATHLFGERARHLVGAGVTQLGGTLRDLRLVQVAYRPERELVGRYAATIAWGAADPVTETLLAGTTADGPPPGTLPLVADDLAVGLWRWPFDPALPGLDTAVTPSRAATLVGAFVGGVPALQVRAYRPTRRAVVRATGPHGEVYLKVVRPTSLDAVVARHTMLAGTVLARTVGVPELLAVDADAGILVMRALPGETLRSRLLDGDARAADPTALIEVLDALAGAPAPSGLGRATSPRATAAGHAALIERVLPDVEGRLLAVLDLLGSAPDAGTTLVHGDLHDGQLTVADGSISGILDLDGVGLGHRVDDIGNLLAHLSTLALGAPRARPTIDATVERIWSEAAPSLGCDELARAAAAATVGLATGPFTAQQARWPVATRRRLALAARWLRRAETDARRHERDLTVGS
ncbi:MAG TPA: aminoglycoside phosphotransferase family protein [Acidimicrobiales bacterium]|nr:aminoglycoside phosphotransferase family protein [Acidimicrobiales bacterium]